MPNNVSIRQLTKQDTEFCCKNWIYSYAKLEKFLESLICLNGGYGIFDTQSNELLCFAIFSEQFSIGWLTTIENSRRKGYAILLSKFMSRKCVEKFDVAPLVFISDQNNVSLNLFVSKLGYEKIGDNNWIAVGNKKY